MGANSNLNKRGWLLFSDRLNHTLEHKLATFGSSVSLLRFCVSIPVEKWASTRICQSCNRHNTHDDDDTHNPANNRGRDSTQPH
jgi:hypothetical protein